MENTNIKADMVESSAFQHLAIKYNVTSVPKVIINEKVEIVGDTKMEELLNKVEEALKGD